MKKLYPQKLLISSFIVCAALFQHANAQITTIAGRHTYLGDSSVVTSAGLFGPYSIAKDAAGNLYIATSSDNRIREVNAITKVITTIAGTGIAGHLGDGGLATAAQLSFSGSSLPGIAIDASGNIYIGDYGNDRVRKINATTHIITTIAGTGVDGYSGDGGVAVAASLSGPSGIALDATGNVYFADNNNSVIRKITVATGKISTVAGNYDNGGSYSGDNGAATDAGLNYPERIAFDVTGNLYIADQQNFRIRKVDATTQIITTVAGNGSKGQTGDGAAATSATLGYIIGITVDTAGNIYLGDPTYSRVRMVAAATQKISTVAGNGTPGYTGDGSAATAAQLKTPTDVLLDNSGNLYIDDNGNNVIRLITTATGKISTFGGDGTNGFTGVQQALQAQLVPQALTYNANGDLLIADGYYYDIRDINTAGTASIYAGTPNPDPASASKGYGGNGSNATFPAVLFNAPLGIVADASNNVYIADVFNNVVRVINYNSKVISNYAGNATAGYSGDASSAVSAELNAPYGIALDASGNLYIADALNNRIRKVNASTKIITTIAGTGTKGATGDGSAATSAELNFPNGVAADASGNVFILDRGNTSVRKITASTGKISTILNTGHVFSGIAVDAAGDIYVSDSTSNTIVRIDKTRYTYQVVAGNGTAGYSGDNGAAKSAQLNTPKGLYIDKNNYIYVADLGNNVIRKIIMGALPVTLETFTGQKNKSTVLLNWSTATEINNSRFDIERKGDNATDWAVIGSVPGHRNSTVTENYTFTDGTPLNGNNYYRLRQVDEDGNYNYSIVVNVLMASGWQVSAYPNPVQSALVLDFNNDINETATITVYNAAGKAVLVTNQAVINGFNHIVLNQVQPLAKGVYFIKLSTKANTYQSKFVRLGN